MNLKLLKERRKIKAEDLREKVINEALTKSNIFELVRENKKPYDTLMARYRCALMEVETKFRVLDEEYSLQYDRNPIEGIKTRIKSLDSIFEKVKRKGIPLTLDSIENNIDDIAGIRVICSFKEDIYTLANCILSQDDVELVERKDYIRNPKPSGYRSLHLIVRIPIFLQDQKCYMKVEIQLRTIAMDFWASLEHKLRYKKDIADEDREYLASEMLECAQAIENLDDRMEKVKEKLSESAENR